MRDPAETKKIRENYKKKTTCQRMHKNALTWKK